MIGGDRGESSCCLACLPVSLPCSGQVEYDGGAPGGEGLWAGAPTVPRARRESACGGNSRRYL